MAGLAARRRRRRIKGLTPCYYCGLPADAIDHTIPQGLLKIMELLDDDVSEALLKELPWLTQVPSCGQCNSVLGSRIFPTMRERKEAVKSYLRKRYARILKTPLWTEEEIDDLGYNLKRMVQNRQNLKQVVAQRIRW